jgi:hypothetical protein
MFGLQTEPPFRVRKHTGSTTPGRRSNRRRGLVVPQMPQIHMFGYHHHLPCSSTVWCFFPNS